MAMGPMDDLRKGMSAWFGRETLKKQGISYDKMIGINRDTKDETTTMTDLLDGSKQNKQGILKSDDEIVNKIIKGVEENLKAGRQAASKALNPDLYSDLNNKAPKTDKP